MRDPVRDSRVADLGLGAHDPLSHRRLADQERVGDRGGAQAAEQTQGERDPRGHAERRVTAGEDQPKTVVAHDALLERRVGVQQRGFGLLARPGRTAAAALRSEG